MQKQAAITQFRAISPPFFHSIDLLDMPVNHPRCWLSLSRGPAYSSNFDTGAQLFSRRSSGGRLAIKISACREAGQLWKIVSNLISKSRYTWAVQCKEAPSDILFGAVTSPRDWASALGTYHAIKLRCGRRLCFSGKKLKSDRCLWIGM